MAGKHLTERHRLDLSNGINRAVERFHTIYRLAVRSVETGRDGEDLFTYLLSIREIACAGGAELDGLHSQTLGDATGLFGATLPQEAANG